MFDISDAEQSLSTVRDFLRLAVKEFTNSNIYYGHGTDNAWDEALYIILQTLEIPDDKADIFLDAKLLQSEKKHLLKLVEKRIKDRVPAAYLTNKAYFCDLEFYVDQRVLIPRSPVAELIEQRFSPWINYDDVSKILDIGTGSGCIAIAAAYAFPEAQVDAVDVSSDSLDVAKINVAKHGLQDSVNLIKSDLFTDLGAQHYDVIISNPPYVDAEDISNMPQEFHHEPLLGLEAGDDGLDLVDIILKQAKNYLTENGILIVEVGNSQEALINKYPDVPFVWLDFARGGDGVFLLTATELKEHF